MNSYSKDILLLNISRFDHYIELANNKANWLLTSLFTLLLGVFALIGYSDIIKNITNGNHIIIHIINPPINTIVSHKIDFVTKKHYNI